MSSWDYVSCYCLNKPVLKVRVLCFPVLSIRVCEALHISEMHFSFISFGTQKYLILCHFYNCF